MPMDGEPTFFCGAAVAGTGVSISQSERTTINYKSKCNFNGDLYGNNCCRYDDDDAFFLWLRHALLVLPAAAADVVDRCCWMPMSLEHMLIVLSKRTNGAAWNMNVKNEQIISSKWNEHIRPLAFREESKIAFLAINYYFVFSCLPQRWRVIIRILPSKQWRLHSIELWRFCAILCTWWRDTINEPLYVRRWRLSQYDAMHAVWSCVPCVQFLVVGPRNRIASRIENATHESIPNSFVTTTKHNKSIDHHGSTPNTNHNL